MTLRLTRRMTALFAALILATVSIVLVEPRAAHAAACAGSTGVTVKVDFTAFAGSVSTQCALGDPASGLAALQGAGFTVAGTARWGLAFICRINGLPSAATEPCFNTPSVSAYWSYWHALPGGTWTYSTSGATSYNPAPGTVEGWAFGAGSPPTVAP